MCIEKTIQSTKFIDKNPNKLHDFLLAFCRINIKEEDSDDVSSVLKHYFYSPVPGLPEVPVPVMLIGVHESFNRLLGLRAGCFHR